MLIDIALLLLFFTIFICSDEIYEKKGVVISNSGITNKEYFCSFFFLGLSVLKDCRGAQLIWRNKD